MSNNPMYAFRALFGVIALICLLESNWYNLSYVLAVWVGMEVSV